MQNVYIATIFVLVELAALGLGWLAWLLIRRKWSAQRRRRVQAQDLKLMAYQLVQAHDTLARQLQACGGANPPSPAEIRLREAIGRLRQLAAQLAGGQVSAFQVSQGLLSAQESILAAFEAAAAHGLPAPAEPRPAAPQDAEQPLAPSGQVDFMGTTERNENAPVSKSEDELQAEINALLTADDFQDKPAPAPPPDPLAVPAPPVPGKQVRGLDDDEFQAEMDELLKPRPSVKAPEEPAAEPAAGEPKLTEAEIEAAMQADLDALLSGSPGDAMPGSLEAPAPGAAPAAEAAAEPKLTEAEIEAMMQADLEEMLSASQLVETPQDAGEANLQAEIDALLSGGLSDESEPVPTPTPVAPAASPAPAADLQAEIDALLSGDGVVEPVTESSPAPAAPAATADLQAEIDALLSGGGALAPGAAPLPAKASAEDLQAEIDALLSGCADEPASEFHQRLETEIEERLQAREQQGAPAPAMAEGIAISQAEIDALLVGAAAGEPASGGQTASPAPVPAALDLQAEIDALFSGGSAPAPAPSVAEPPPVQKSQSTLDLQAEIDALLGGGGQELVRSAPSRSFQAPLPSQAASNLQAEIDALLAGAAAPAPPAASPTPTPPATLDLQAEIDALLMGATGQP